PRAPVRSIALRLTAPFPAPAGHLPLVPADRAAFVASIQWDAPSAPGGSIVSAWLARSCRWRHRVRAADALSIGRKRVAGQLPPCPDTRYAFAHDGSARRC